MVDLEWLCWFAERLRHMVERKQPLSSGAMGLDGVTANRQPPKDHG